MASLNLSKRQYEVLSDFRYQLRCFLRFSEELTHSYGVTNLQYLLVLHVKGFKGRDWATIGELAERLQSHHNGVVALTARCAKMGLIFKKRGTADKRQVEIHLTKKGNVLVTKLGKLHRAELVGLQKVFKPEILRSRRY